MLASLAATALLVAAIPATAFTQADEPPVQVHSPSVDGDLRLHRLVSKVFGNTRYLRVLLPDGYDAPENAARRYPVLYMADGQNLFDPTTSVFGPSEWRMDETVHALVSAGRIPPLIVVGVDDAGRFARDHEYLPWPDTASAAVYAHYDPTPQGKQYPAFLLTEVMPYINTHYRTLTDASHTGIGGSSYGALISVYVVASHAGVFGRLLAESPILGVYGGEMLREAAAGQRWPDRVYLGVGTNEVGAPSCNPASPPPEGKAIVNDVRSLASILGHAGLDSSRLRLVIAPCATHTHAAWAARLPDALTFLFREP